MLTTAGLTRSTTSAKFTSEPDADGWLGGRLAILGVFDAASSSAAR
jgi:hypothetical protein